MDQDIEQIRADIAALELPFVEEVPATVFAELPAVPDYKPDVPQVVTVGSQIAEFSKNVPVDLRPTIANCIIDPDVIVRIHSLSMISKLVLVPSAFPSKS